MKGGREGERGEGWAPPWGPFYIIKRSKYCIKAVTLRL